MINKQSMRSINSMGIDFRDLGRFRLGSFALMAVTLASSAFPYSVRAQSPQNTPVPGLIDPVQPGANPMTATWPSNGAAQGMPAGGGNFWQSFLSNRINAGTVLTGTMQDDLSSKKSNVGDVFTVLIDQGYSVQDKVVVPPGSRVMGTVTAVAPAKTMRNGAPGNLSISLQQIVFPDGRSAPIAAFVQFNPNQNDNRNTVAGKKGKLDNKIPLASYGNSLKGMGYNSVSGLTRMFGVRYSPQAHLHPGSEFTMNKGEQLALRLNRTLDLATMSAPTAPPWGDKSANTAAGGATPAQPFGQQVGATPAFGPRDAAAIPNSEPF